MARSRTRPSESFEHYLLSVTGWDYSYYLFIERHRRVPTQLSEIPTLTFLGDWIRPKGSPYPKGSITLSGRARMLENVIEAPKAIGSLTAKQDQLDAYVFIPTERLAPLSAVAASGRVRIVSMTATPIRRRSGQVISLSVDTKFDEEEW